MQFANATKRTAPCNDCNDSSVQAGFPKKNRSEGERGARNTWIPQCRIRYRSVTYAFGYHIMHTMYMESRLKAGV